MSVASRNSRFSTKSLDTRVASYSKATDSLSDASTVVDDLEPGRSKSNNEVFWYLTPWNIRALFPSGDTIVQELESMVPDPELFQNGVNVECLVIGPDKAHCALKRYDTKWEWKYEAREIKKFGEFQHPAISPALATIKIGGKYYILFPWAKHGSLRDFWYENPDPAKLADDVELWLLQQCFGIAHALMEIHGDLLVPSRREISYVLHGDIKPENILCFPTDQTHTDAHGSIVPEPDLGRLKLTCFGPSKFREPSTEESIETTIAFRLNYRPLETEILKGFINQATDIWSLGCVFLEFATWYVMGARGLEAFINTWRNTNNLFPGWGGQVMDAAFFSFGTRLHPDKSMLNSSLIADIREHPRSTKAIHAFLDFIETKMLVHEDKRATAITVAAALWNLLRSSSNNSGTWGLSMAGGNDVPQDKEQLRLTLYDPFNPPSALDRWRVWLESLLGFNPVDGYSLPQSKLTWRVSINNTTPPPFPSLHDGQDQFGYWNSID
ncbi:hypothetical protein GQX73_g4172 [Xylaria multiplex]|uniref:Protein kinase domain-containing protein n=1 Tax=Xylaria multiplex TaxID=323545 RepID=A0A7C8J2J6_9PEZI|nr:hypothetical protein GQX73_g4172 [Xylaria multiplex]